VEQYVSQNVSLDDAQEPKRVGSLSPIPLPQKFSMTPEGILSIRVFKIKSFYLKEHDSYGSRELLFL
jgi:hypothetical protein